MWRQVFIGLLIALNVVVAGAVLTPQTASAATQAECEGNSSITILPKWYKYLNPQFNDQTQGCDLSPGFPAAIPLILLAVFEIILRVAGILAVVFVVVGGFQYLTSAGEPDKAKNARTTIVNALVGLMLAMLATVIVNLIGGNIG